MRIDAISLSLGLGGFRVLDTIEDEGRVDVVVELTAEAGICPACGAISTTVHERSD